MKVSIIAFVLSFICAAVSLLGLPETKEADLAAKMLFFSCLIVGSMLFIRYSKRLTS